MKNIWNRFSEARLFVRIAVLFLVVLTTSGFAYAFAQSRTSKVIITNRSKVTLQRVDFNFSGYTKPERQVIQLQNIRPGESKSFNFDSNWWQTGQQRFIVAQINSGNRPVEVREFVLPSDPSLGLIGERLRFEYDAFTRFNLRTKL